MMAAAMRPQRLSERLYRWRWDDIRTKEELHDFTIRRRQQKIFRVEHIFAGLFDCVFSDEWLVKYSESWSSAFWASSLESWSSRAAASSVCIMDGGS